MIRPVIKVDGKRYVVIEERELRKLERAAMNATPKKTKAITSRRSARQTIAPSTGSASNSLPPLPPADENGNRPAVEFARVSIARSIIRDRQAAELSQQELARLAGIRQETISRIESGKHSPTLRTVEKIDRVLRQAIQNGRKRDRRQKRK